MASLLRPFTGYVPTSEFGRRVVSPPKALLDADQRGASAEDPFSFRHSVGRGAGPSSDVALAWLRDTANEGALTPVHDALMVHAATRAGRTSLGILGDISVDAYERGDIKPHEKTIASTEQKMVGYMLLTRILGNPVVVAHRHNAALADLLRAYSSGPADADFEARDGTRHQLWTVTGEDATDLTTHFTDDLYIADGHHRIETARVLARTEKRTDVWIPAGLYAEDEFAVWAFARGVHNAPLTSDDLIAKLAADFELDPIDAALPRPPAPGTFGVRIDGRSFILTIPASQITGDVHDRLDVSLLQSLILEPMLGITDPRRDDRLDVIADSGDAAHDPDLYDAWFLPYPTSPGEVMAVADLDRTMPPKSTYFLPKLPGGILIRPL